MACRARPWRWREGPFRRHHGPREEGLCAAEHVPTARTWAHKIRIRHRRTTQSTTAQSWRVPARASAADRRAAAMSQNFRSVVRVSSGSIVKSLRIPPPHDGSSVCSQPTWAVGALTPHQRRGTTLSSAVAERHVHSEASVDVRSHEDTQEARGLLTC